MVLLDLIGKKTSPEVIDIFKLHNNSLIYVQSNHVAKDGVKIVGTKNLEAALKELHDDDKQPPNTRTTWIMFANDGRSHQILVPVFDNNYCPPGELEFGDMLAFHGGEKTFFGRWRKDQYYDSLKRQYEREIMRYNEFGIDLRNPIPITMHNP